MPVNVAAYHRFEITRDIPQAHHLQTQRLRYCLQHVRRDIEPQTFRAFALYVLDEWPVDRVAAHLQINANQVYLAKSRVTKMLKSRMSELLGDDP